MSSVTVYVINDDGFFECERTGDIDSVMLALDIEQTDFTMQPPPLDIERRQRWQWVNNEWIDSSPITTE